MAIAPDGASERLRRVINKQLTESDLLAAAEKLTEAGLHRLKLYLMIGLPTETIEDLEEFVDLVQRIREVMHEIGRKRGRLSEISISVNSFVPKPWTPFQYHPFGASAELDGEKRFGAGGSAEYKGKNQVSEKSLWLRFQTFASSSTIPTRLFSSLYCPAETAGSHRYC